MEPMHDERLLELLMAADEASRTELDALRRDPEVAARLASLESLLDRSRRAARAWPRPDAERERALVDGILDRTTRDVSWRGDLRLVVGFVRERVAESALIKVVAASLVLHLLAGTGLALLRIGQPQRPPVVLTIELPEPIRPEPVEEPAELDPASVESRALARTAWDASFLLARARYQLLHRPGPLPSAQVPGPQAPLEIRLLDARSRYLHGQGWQDWLDAPETVEGAQGAALGILGELVLDRFARDGERAPGLHRVLLRVADSARDEGPARDLLVAVAGRALGYGVLEVGHEGLELEPRLDPVDADWASRLERALGPELASEPAVQGWVSPGS